MIPVASPLSQYLRHKDAIDAAIHRVLGSGSYILGEEVEAFEEEFAAYVGVRFAVGVGNGTEALYLALRACGVGPGDEVVTVSHTAIGTVMPILLCGATPVFADIDPTTYTMDLDSVVGAIGPRTRAVVPVHIYGHPADIEGLLEIGRERSIHVIEDCAQATGARVGKRRVGSFGTVGCFSFYPTKNLGALGDGGAVVTDDPSLAGKVRLLREYGWAQRFISSLRGWNSRLDALQASILRVKLRHLEEDNASRARLAQIYRDGLDGTSIAPPAVRDGVTHVYHLYVVRSDKREQLREHLRVRGIGTGVHYPVPVHLQPACVEYARRLPETERAAGEVLSLPMYPELSADDVWRVIEFLREFDRPDHAEGRTTSTASIRPTTTFTGR